MVTTIVIKLLFLIVIIAGIMYLCSQQETVKDKSSSVEKDQAWTRAYYDALEQKEKAARAGGRREKANE